MAYQPKSYRKFVATAATATLVASAVTPAFAAETGAAATFTDVPERYQTAVDYLLENQVTNGYTDTQFGTTMSIKRVDAAVMIAKALDLDLSDRPASGFSDVPERAAVYVDALKAEGIVNGKSATEFGAAENITRGEMALIVAKAYDLTGDGSDLPFTDVAPRYQDAVAALVDAGITFGKTATSFGTTQEITRGEFALFLYRAETGDELKVSNVSVAVNQQSATVTADVANAEAGANAKVEIFANGGSTVAATQEVAVVDGKVNATFNELPAGTHTAKVTVGEESAQTNFTVSVIPAAVQSVTALNANEIQVVFNKELSETSAEDAANYVVNVNGVTGVDVATGTPELQEDKKTVIVPLNASLANGNSFKVIVDKVRTSDLQDVPKYESSAQVFNDKIAASLLSAEVNGTKLKVIFNEPVSNTGTTEFYVDGVKITDVTLAQASSYSLGNYEYELDLTGGEATDLGKVGTHKVEVYFVNDAAGNSTTYSATQYVVSNDTQAPSISKLEAKEQDQFKIFVSEPLAGFTAGNITVSKGGYTFNSTNDISLGAYNATEKSYTVTVDTNAAGTDTLNPLYKTNENSANLSVEIKDYRDAAGYIGNAFTGSVTLTKDVTAPKLEDNRLAYADSNNSDLFVKFDENVTIADATKITVRDKEGVRIVPNSYGVSQGKGETGTTEYVRADLPTLGSTEYTVEFAAGAIQDAYGNKNTGTLTSKVTTSVADGVSLPVVYSATPAGDRQLSIANNVITIDYGQIMDSSAIQLANYKFNGSAFPAGTSIGWGTDKQTVEITLPDNTFSIDTTALITISSEVKTDSGKKVYANANTGDENVIKLGATDINDNIEPKLSSAAYVVPSNDATTSNNLRLTFTENVLAVDDAAHRDDFAVVVNGKKIAVTNITDIDGDNVLELTLGESVNVAQVATITVETDTTLNPTINVTDASTLNNKLTAGSVTATTKER
ncbi:S-layer homology domain-containing protein [Domibacillus enclensis]|uniref:S-layer homology domain-containing protein n=1 Tax=Domibacillus enclensis TaxID=1017273 RepID=A0A1N6RKK7_9BACI|nr:S-layer homology domain-containing protein [Domibacillus enclensis]OXS79084.1 hypothetical protein B1B05_04715 [Domibacillus enclensis]SIQ29345.1 S-layer homology domain-containing protein [Domibacillus enclensis]